MEKKIEQISEMLEKISGGKSANSLFDVDTNMASTGERCTTNCTTYCPSTTGTNNGTHRGTVTPSTPIVA